MIQQTSPAGLNTAEPHSALSVNTQPRFVSVKHTTVFSLVICVCLAEVTLLMEMFTLQLSTSLSSTCCSSLDSCRHTVFDYSTELIGLQEALTQIPTANMEQLERFLLGMNEQSGHRLLSAHWGQAGWDLLNGSKVEHCHHPTAMKQSSH